MSNPSKQKGTAAETAAVAWFRSHGWVMAERRALAGKADKGDVAGIPGIVCEVKSCKQHDLAGWTRELEAEIENDGADLGFILAKKRGTTNVDDWYAIMPAGMLAQLLKEAGR